MKALYYTKTSLSGDIVQDYDPRGVDQGAVGDFTTTAIEKLPLQDLSLKISNIDPNAFRELFDPLQLSPTVLYTFPDLPREIQVAFLTEVLEQTADIWDNNMWNGDRAGGVAPANKYNGWLKELSDAYNTTGVASPVDATLSGVTTFDVTNIFSVVDNVKSVLYSDPTMKAVESRYRNFLKLYCSKNTANLLRTAEQNTAGKGETRLTGGSIYDMNYSGAFKIQPLANFPDDKLLLTYGDGSSKANTNLHFGMTNQADAQNVQVFRMANGSNYVGMRMDVSVGTKVVFPEQCITVGIS